MVTVGLLMVNKQLKATQETLANARVQVVTNSQSVNGLVDADAKMEYRIYLVEDWIYQFNKFMFGTDESSEEENIPTDATIIK